MKRAYRRSWIVSVSAPVHVGAIGCVVLCLLSACTSGASVETPDGAIADRQMFDTEGAGSLPDARAGERLEDSSFVQRPQTPEPRDDALGCELGEPIEKGRLDPALSEVSGLATTGQARGVLWAHMDSGDDAQLYSLSDTGTIKHTVRLEDIEAIDWEDIASGPCNPGEGERGCLYIGDIGDNFASRQAVFVHRLAAPGPEVRRIPRTEVETIRLTYPDGPRDCEALIVDDNGTVLLLTKLWGEFAFEIYAVPFKSGGGEAILDKVATVDISDIEFEVLGLVTGADFDSASGRLAVRTYNSIILYALGPEVDFSAVATAERRVYTPTSEPQGEAICFGHGGLFHVSEGAAPPLWWIPCP